MASRLAHFFHLYHCTTFHPINTSILFMSSRSKLSKSVFYMRTLILLHVSLNHIACVAYIWHIATNVARGVVCMSVCLLVTWRSCTKPGEPIEILLVGCLLWADEPCIRWGRDSHRVGAILGVVWPVEKHWESAVLYTAKGFIQSQAPVMAYSEKNHLLLNNSMTAGLLQLTAILPAAILPVTLCCPIEKSAPHPAAAFCQNFLTSTYCYFNMVQRNKPMYVVVSTVDTSLLSNIQKLFSEKIEIFSPVDFTKVSVLTGIIKISLKVRSHIS